MSSYAFAYHQSGESYAVEIHESGRVLTVIGPIRAGIRNDGKLGRRVATTGSADRARWLALELAVGRATISLREVEPTARI